MITKTVSFSINKTQSLMDWSTILQTIKKKSFQNVQ